MSPSLRTKNSFLLDAKKGEESKPREEQGCLALCFHLSKKETQQGKSPADVQ